LVAGFDDQRVSGLTQRLASAIAPPTSRMHLLRSAVYRDPPLEPPRRDHHHSQHTFSLAGGASQVTRPLSLRRFRCRQILQFDPEGASWSTIQ
jgi:hypothetical protein